MAHLTKAQLKSLGAKMHNWHASMGDPIYAVGSFFFSGDDYPDLEVVRAALARHEKDLAHPHPSWGPKDLGQIRAIIRDLNVYITSKDPVAAYKQGENRYAERVEAALRLGGVTTEAAARLVKNCKNDVEYGYRKNRWPSSVAKEIAGREHVGYRVPIPGRRRSGLGFR